MRGSEDVLVRLDDDDNNDDGGDAMMGLLRGVILVIR